MLRRELRKMIQKNLVGALFTACMLSGISVFASNNNIDPKIVQDDNTLVTNYYEQKGAGGNIVKVNALTGNKLYAEEEGYKSFTFTTETAAYRNDSVINITRSNNVSKVTRNTQVVLPISCLESAEYVIGLKYDSSLSPKYPGYNSQIITALDTKIEMVTGNGSYTLDEEIDAHYSDAPYDFGNNDYDGIVAINSKEEIHAVSVAVRFSNGSFIAVERNAGYTQIYDGHVGDNNWLMNYYSSPAAFKNSLGGDYKIYALKYQP